MNETTPQYPECEKLEKVSTERQSIIEFLEWCQSNGYHLAKYGEPLGYVDFLIPLYADERETVILQSLNIDRDTLNQERQTMLRELQTRS